MPSWNDDFSERRAIILGAFAELRKATIRCVMSVRLSAWNDFIVIRFCFHQTIFHTFAAITEALIVAGHKFLYTLLIECGRLRC